MGRQHGSHCDHRRVSALSIRKQCLGVWDLRIPVMAHSMQDRIVELDGSWNEQSSMVWLA